MCSARSRSGVDLHGLDLPRSAAPYRSTRRCHRRLRNVERLARAIVFEYPALLFWTPGLTRSRGDPRLFERGDTNLLGGRRCGRRCGFPRIAQGNTVQKREAALPGRRPGSRSGESWTSRAPRLHLDQNVLGQLRRGSLGLDSGLSGGLFSAAAGLESAPASPFGANVALGNGD